MTANMIHALKDGATKAEEIAWLRRLAETVPADSLLAPLFGPDSLHWLIDRIGADMPADLFGALADTANRSREHREAAETAGRALHASIQESEGLAVRLENARIDINFHMSGIRELEGKLEEKTREAAMAKLEADARAKELELEIVRLKARMFDLLQETGRI